MIDYEMLCQTIEDWRAGRRPSIDLSPAPVGSAPAEDYAEVDADQDYAAEDQGQYGEPGQEYGYEDDGSGAYAYDDGSPAHVPGSGTAPVDVSDVEY